MSVFKKKQCLHQWSNPMASNSHPEPSPVWIIVWPWENKPWWTYEIVDDTVDDDDDDDDFDDDSEDVTCPSSEVHWQAVSKVFEPLHHINNYTEPKVSIHLSNPQPLWKRLCVKLLPQWLIYSMSLPRLYNGSITTGRPLIVDTGASVCITPNKDNCISYRDSKVKIEDQIKHCQRRGLCQIENSWYKRKDCQPRIIWIPHSKCRGTTS